MTFEVSPHEPDPEAVQKGANGKTLLSERGTFVQLSLGIAILVSTITATVFFARVNAKVDATANTAAALQALAEGQSVSQQELNKNLIVVQGDIRNLVEKIDEFKIDKREDERSAQERKSEIVRLQAEAQAFKDRIAILETSVRAVESGAQSAVKALEARVLSLEIAISTARAGAAARSGGE